MIIFLIIGILLLGAAIGDIAYVLCPRSAKQADGVAEIEPYGFRMADQETASGADRPARRDCRGVPWVRWLASDGRDTDYRTTRRGAQAHTPGTALRSVGQRSLDEHARARRHTFDALVRSLGRPG